MIHKYRCIIHRIIMRLSIVRKCDYLFPAETLKNGQCIRDNNACFYSARKSVNIYRFFWINNHEHLNRNWREVSKVSKKNARSGEISPVEMIVETIRSSGNARNRTQQRIQSFVARQFTNSPENASDADSSPLRRLRSFFLRREEVSSDRPERGLRPYRRERTCLFASISARITASKALFTSIHWKLIESDSRMRDAATKEERRGRKGEGEKRVDPR